MQGSSNGQAGQDDGSAAVLSRVPDWQLLAFLLLVAAGIHAWLIATTSVTARDSIGYIRYAHRLETESWQQILPKIQQHPLYSLAVLGLSYPMRWLEGGVTPQGMALCGQLVAAFAGCLLIVPMFHLGRELFDRRVGFWAAALFQLLPISAEVTSDGLSDGLFLLLLTSALLFGVQGLHRQAPGRFVLCGLFVGLAYLTRPEGALAGVAVFLVLLGMQYWPALRWPRPRLAWGAVGLVVAAVVVALPYMLVIGGITVKPATNIILNRMEYRLPTETSQSKDDDDTELRASQEPSPLAVVLGVWWVDEGKSGGPPWWWGLRVLVVETIHAFHYVAWVPALLGLWWFRDRLHDRPGLAAPLLLSLLLALILWRLVLKLGYLSERHTLVLVLCGSFWAAAALVRIADNLPGWLERRFGRPLPARAQAALGLGFLLLLTGWCLPATLKPLHANRAGFRAAGEWLAANTLPGDTVVDPFCWAHFYAGQVFQEAAKPQRGSGTSYVVVTNSKNSHNRLTSLPAARELARQGTLVFRWTPSARQLKRYRAEEVEVYAVPSSRTPRKS
ncbi:MAG: glycosyltransferase family 39 protein [Planctomycetia bacterium]|nr:glycosyltransferase family 39 protein [Planctomycetia bacterium]